MTIADDEPTIDFAHLHALSPALWRIIFEELDPENPAKVHSLKVKALRMIGCLEDIQQRLPEIGLSLAQYLELRKAAFAAEDAAEDRWRGVNPSAGFRIHEALSPAMRDFIVNLHLRGLPNDRISCALDDMHPEWITHAITHADLTDRDRAVCAGHLAGWTLPRIIRECRVAETTVKRIIERRLGEEARTNTRQAATERAEEARRLRARGRSNAEIAELMKLPETTIKNYFKTARRPRAADPFQSGKRRQRRRGPAE